SATSCRSRVESSRRSSGPIAPRSSRSSPSPRPARSTKPPAPAPSSSRCCCACTRARTSSSPAWKAASSSTSCRRRSPTSAGSSTASTTFHPYRDDLPEQPAMVYITGVAQLWDGKVYVYGGGFFIADPPVPLREGFRRKALVGSTEDEILERELVWEGIGARG